MTREEAEAILTAAGQAEDDAFPLLEAAIACAIHDYPFREAFAHLVDYKTVIGVVLRGLGEAGRGVVVLIREPYRAALSDRVRAKIEIAGGNKDAGRGQLRDYGVGAQILLDLGVRDMVLLSNTKRTIIGLEGYGLSVVEQRPILVAAKKARY